MSHKITNVLGASLETPYDLGISESNAGNPIETGRERFAFKG